jgi:dipeptidyl aminopeptidase/acylaminoacyl peptidase
MRSPLFLFFAFLLTGCSVFSTPVPTTGPTVVIPATTKIATTSMPPRTLQSFEEYTIDYLRQRAYGGGKIEVVKKISETELFTSYAIRYPSDGLTIYGFMNIPKGKGAFPVIVSVHGYSLPGKYDPFNVSQDSADFLAANRFIVVHPGLRNHRPSDVGDNLLRVGMTIDVMNLIALLKQKNDLPAELSNADVEMFGLWGTSMGGEIALRILTISPDIKATVLHASLSGNIERNSRQLYDVLRDPQFHDDAKLPLEMLDHVSPMYYYHTITSAVQLHHGTADEVVPVSWAEETCDLLHSAGVFVRCIYYKDAGHFFSEETSEKLRWSALKFYRAQLR